MKKILKVFLYFGLFIGLQVLATIFAIVQKTYTDIEWATNLLNVTQNIQNVEAMNEYLTLCYELIPSIMFFTFILGIIPFFIIALKKHNKYLKKLNIYEIITIFSCAISLNLLISGIIALIPQNIQENYNSAVGYIDSLSMWSLLFAVGIFAPIIEEIFFRYFMVGALKKKSILAILLPAILFGVSHGNLVQGTYAFVLGVIFGIVYLYTNNLWITILLHMGINSSSVLFTFMPIYINVMICIFAIIITIEFLYRQYKKVPHNIWKLIWLYKKNVLNIWKEIKTTKDGFSFIQKISKDMNEKLELNIIVKGKEYLKDLKEPFVIYSNHRGMYDPLLITSQINQNLSYVLKKELINNKLISQVASITNSEYFGRTPKEDLTTILSMINKNKEGTNYLIFPEGTRNTKKELLEFKGGSFKIPLKSYCDILPIAIFYTENVFEKNYKDKKVVLHYLPPIHYDDYKEMNSLDLAKYVQEEIQDVINDIIVFRF